MDEPRLARTPVLGHEVLGLLADLGGEVGVERLREEVRRVFGPDPLFSNCHGREFSLETLLSFFVSRGKLALSGDRVRLGPVAGCQQH